MEVARGELPGGRQRARQLRERLHRPLHQCQEVSLRDVAEHQGPALRHPRPMLEARMPTRVAIEREIGEDRIDTPLGFSQQPRSAEQEAQ